MARKPIYGVKVRGKGAQVTGLGLQTFSPAGDSFWLMRASCPSAAGFSRAAPGQRPVALALNLTSFQIDPASPGAASGSP